MAVWIVRAGSHGEFEQKFIQDGRVYVTWDGFDKDMSRMPDRPALNRTLTESFPEAKPRAISNWVTQLWPFAHDMKAGDLVVVPLKQQPAIQIGEITGDYHFEPAGPDPYFHWRPVKWIGEAIPRANFAQDLLYSFGAFMTICRVQRNNAEQRLEAMRKNGWKPEKGLPPPPNGPGGTGDVPTDLEELARDQIAQLISIRFKGHDFTRLVDAILTAQGYTTYRSPEGADGGAGILAGAGPLGFGAPKLCVEVKSGDTPVDRPTVDKLLGAMTKFGAQEGLFVSWSGFKSNVQKELAGSFFRLRLWSQKELLAQLFATYDQLDGDLKAELPLKRLWTVTAPEAD